MQEERAGEAASIVKTAHELAVTARALHARGWAPATSGNFSARLGPTTALITASGKDKGELGRDDFLVIDLDGAPVGADVSLRPSAEAPLHGELYRRFGDAGAVLHVHGPASTVISMEAGASDSITLAGYEMLKALAGVTTHHHVEVIPVVPNDQDTTRLALEVGARLDRLPGAHAYLIAGHGLYTWGRTVREARRHVEALEFIFDCELRRGVHVGGRGGVR